MRSRAFPATLSLAAIGLLPVPAQAHLASTRLGDFYGGALHPLSGFEFVLPWLALVILAALQGAHRGRWLFAIFPVGLLIGSALSVLAPHVTFIGAFNIAVISITGLLVAWGVVIPLPLFLALAMTAALGPGYENGAAITSQTDPILFIAGIATVGYVFSTLAGATTLAFLEGRGGWRPVALRAVGSWIAAVGIMIVGFQLSHLTIGR